jgi:uncharacterized RDD family membrane protein YckC
MGAGVFDAMLLLTIALMLLLEIIIGVPMVTSATGATLDSPDATALWAVLALLWIGTSAVLLPSLYYTLAEGAYGQTLGKALFRIKVVSNDGQPISYGRAFTRLLILPYALLPAGLGLLWAALPPAKRGWHDYMSATRVVTSTLPLSLEAPAEQDHAIAAPHQRAL